MADINSNDGPTSPPHSPPLNNDDGSPCPPHSPPLSNNDPMDIDDDAVTSDELEFDTSDSFLLGLPKDELDALIAEVEVLVQNDGNPTSTTALSTGGNSTSTSSELSTEDIGPSAPALSTGGDPTTTSSALSAGGNPPSSSSTPSAHCFAVKADDTTKSAIYFDEYNAQLYVTSLLEPEGCEAMITPFRNVDSAYESLHPRDPLPAAHPIHPINIGLFRGGNDIDNVSQAIINDIHFIYGTDFDVENYVNTYLRYLHTDKKSMILAYDMLNNLLKDNVGGDDDDDINKLSRMILRVAARAFITLPKRKDGRNLSTEGKIRNEDQQTQILASDVYLCDPFAAEVFVEILQIADRGDFMNFCYTLCPNQKGHSLCNGGFCPDNLQLDDCSSYCLMQKFDALLGESSYTFGVFGTFVNNVRISCPNKPEPYLHCPAVSKFEGWVQASLLNMIKRSLIDMGVNLFVFALSGLWCGIMDKMFALIEPEVPNTENGKFTICYDSVHISICAKYNRGNVRDQCGLCFRVVEALSDARDAHLSAVMKGGIESNCLLDALTADHAFPFVTNIESTIAMLEGCFKQRPKGSGTSRRNDEHARQEAECNRKKQIELEARLYPPEYLEHVTRQANTNRRKAPRQATSPPSNPSVLCTTNRYRTFEEQVDRLTAYKAEHDNCHVPREYKDDTVLGIWVMNVRQRNTILSEEQKQILDAMGFAWDIGEINASKRDQMVLVVRLIVNLLSLYHNFTNNLSHSGE